MLRELRDWVEELACRAGFDGLPSTGRAAAWVAGAIAICVAGALWWSGAAGAGTPAGAAGAAPRAGTGGSAEASRAMPATAATVTVHVVGEVRRPGVYELAGGSRVVADGEQIAIPRQGEGGPAIAAAPGAASKPGKIDLNTATEAQLDTLPGVGPSTAGKIVSDRTENGPFRTVDDLMRVPGIGPAKLDALKDLVTVG